MNRHMTKALWMAVGLALLGASLPGTAAAKPRPNGDFTGGDGGKPAQDQIDSENGKVRIASADKKRRPAQGDFTGGDGGKPAQEQIDAENGKVRVARARGGVRQAAYGDFTGGDGGKPAQEQIDSENGKVRVARAALAGSQVVLTGLAEFGGAKQFAFALSGEGVPALEP